VQRVLAALLALDQTSYFQFRGQIHSRQELKATLDGKSVLDQLGEETLRDEGARCLVGGQANARLHRSVTYAEGSAGTQAAGEVRLVSGVSYISGEYVQFDPSYPPLPKGWMRVNGQASLLYWPTLGGIYLTEMLDWVQGDVAKFLSGSSLEQLRTTFGESLALATSQREVLTDGTPVEVITLTLTSSALPVSVQGVEEQDPVAQAVYQATPGTPIQHRFILDLSGHLRGWEQTVRIEAQDVDVGAAPNFPPGTRLDISAYQSMAAYVSVPDKPGTIAAPAAEAMAHVPSRSPSGASAALAFSNLQEFDAALNAAAEGGSLDSFWQQITAGGQMPLIFGDYGVFLYRCPAKSVAWAGDWTRSIPSLRLGNTDLWMHVAQFPNDARLEYQIELDGGQGILDPLNLAVEVGGLGSKSVFAMPGYVFPSFTLPREGIAQGKLTGNIALSSKALGYTVNYRVYTPAGYDRLKSLPCLYVTDGQDYLEFGKMVTVLDNLLAEGKVQPLIAVFIDPRDTVSGRNLREEQFLNNPKYGQFIADELVPTIDAAYRTNRSADARALLGASYGGYHGAYFALRHSDKFHLFAMQSPSFSWDATILDEYKKAARLPVKMFISVGRFNDATYQTRLVRQVLEDKGYPLLYLESNEGHSYGNWRGKLDAMLTYFFGVKK